MAKLIFKGAEVARLYDYTIQQKEHVPTFGMLLDDKYLKDGETVPKGGYAKREQIDFAKVPAHLVLVRDQGVYLMSSASQRLLDQDGKRSVVAYAEGYGPDSFKSIPGLSGDDFVEGLELQYFKEAIDDKATEVYVHVTQRRIKVSWMPSAPPERKLPHVTLSDVEQVIGRQGKGAVGWGAWGEKYTGPVVGIIADKCVIQKAGKQVGVSSFSVQ